MNGCVCVCDISIVFVCSESFDESTESANPVSAAASLRQPSATEADQNRARSVAMTANNTTSIVVDKSSEETSALPLGSTAAVDFEQLAPEENSEMSKVSGRSSVHSSSVDRRSANSLPTARDVTEGHNSTNSSSVDGNTANTMDNVVQQHSNNENNTTEEDKQVAETENTTHLDVPEAGQQSVLRSSADVVSDEQSRKSVTRVSAYETKAQRKSLLRRPTITAADQDNEQKQQPIVELMLDASFEPTEIPDLIHPRLGTDNKPSAAFEQLRSFLAECQGHSSDDVFMTTPVAAARSNSHLGQAVESLKFFLATLQ